MLKLSSTSEIYFAVKKQTKIHQTLLGHDFPTIFLGPKFKVVEQEDFVYYYSDHVKWMPDLMPKVAYAETYINRLNGEHFGFINKFDDDSCIIKGSPNDFDLYTETVICVPFDR